MKTSKKNQNISFGKLYSPYATTPDSTMGDFYEAYKADPENRMRVGDKIFSKIITRAEYYGYNEPTIFVAVELEEPLRVGEVLSDEEGRIFTLKCFGMFRYAGDDPEWHLKVENLFIQGQDTTIGDYLCKVKKEGSGI